MDLVDYCKANGALEILYEGLNEVVEYYKQTNTLQGFPNYQVVIDLPEDEDNELIQQFEISISYIQGLTVHVSATMIIQDYYGTTFGNPEDVDIDLDINQVRVLKLFLEHFVQYEPRIHSRIGL